MEKLPLFDISRNSFVDGPGIRTTVFFRGCNLRCTWCHNPESQSGRKHLFFYESKCLHCGICAKVCPVRAFEQFGCADPKNCNYCRECEYGCPGGALKLCGMDMTEEELLTILKKDAAYYARSGGGVTFSGGECMLYPSLLAPLMAQCKANGISTAVDTAGCVPWTAFEQVMPYADLFLYDVKTMDTEKHRRYTGADNESILDNLRKLFDAGAKIWVRMPIIPTVNDTEEEVLALKVFLAPYAPEHVELLPYHRMGEPKYASLGSSAVHFEVPSAETMARLRALLV